MIVASDLESFFARPAGACIVGDGAALWYREPNVAGSIHWGVLEPAHVHGLRDLLDRTELRRGAGRVVLVTECRDVERAEPDAVLALASLARDAVSVWSTSIERHVVLVPAGVSGLLIAGALSLPSPAHPIAFLDHAHALRDDPVIRAANETAVAAVDAVRGRPSFVTRARAALAHDLSSPTVGACAARLGISARTLQRELRRAGSSFSTELRRARAATARTLLAHTDLKLETIAARVGLASTTRMSEILRQEFNVAARHLRRSAHRVR